MEGLRKRIKHITHNSQIVGRDLSPVDLIYEAGVKATPSRYLVPFTENVHASFFVSIYL
jgi:hypothetical protein